MSDQSGDGGALKSVGQGAILFASGKAAEIIFGFSFTILLTNTLGESNYGTYALAFTVISLVASIAPLGVDKAILRFVPADREKRDEYWTFSICVAGICTLLVSGLLYAIAPQIVATTIRGPEFLYTLRLFSLLILPIVVVEIIRGTLRAINRPRLSTLLYQVVRPFSKLVVVGAVILITREYSDVLVAVIAGTTASALIGVMILFSYTPVKPRFPSSINKERYLQYALPTAFKDLGSLLYARADILMLGYFVAASDIGVYNVAIALATMVVLPLDAINEIFPPVVSQLWSNNRREKVEQLFSTVTRWIITISLPAVCGMVIFRYEFLSIMGSGFVDGGAILTVLLIGQFVNTAVGPSGYLLLMTDRHWLETINQWIFGIVNIGINYALIARYGAFGAAIATTITLIGLNSARLAAIYVIEGWSPHDRQIGKPIIASLPMILIGITIQTVTEGTITLLISIPACILTYFGILYILGISNSDREVYNQLKNV